MADSDPSVLTRSELVDLVSEHERKLLAGVATHTEMRTLTDAELELMRRDARTAQDDVVAERATRTSVHATGENLLRTSFPA